MKRQISPAIAGVAALVLMCLPANAVTLQLDVQTEGEPVPVTAVSFETPDGEEITSIELVDVPRQATVPPDAPQTGETPDVEVQTQPEVAAVDNLVAEPPVEQAHRTIITLNIPDELIARDIVIVLRKDEELVKREPLTVSRDVTAVAVEAYDPADAKLSIDLSQPEVCRRGNDCRYKVAITNTGSGIYKGPLFLTGPLSGNIVEPAAEAGGLFCKYAGGGEQLCYSRVSVQPGQSLTWSLKARLPERLSQNTSNCLEISSRHEMEGRKQRLLQAVQFGLAVQGISSGRPDGIMGPKTRAAIDQFAARQGLDLSASLQSVFAELFEMPPDRMARLGLVTANDCEKLSLVPPPKQVKPKVSKAKKPKRSGDRTNSTADRDDDLNRAVGIGIGIGIGILGGRLGGDKKHDRKKKLEPIEKE